MAKSLEVMMGELEALKEQREPYLQIVDNFNRKIYDLQEEINLRRIKDGLFRPLSDLFEYKGKEIVSISLIEKNNDKTYNVVKIYNNDGKIWVGVDGRLNYSSPTSGTLTYSYTLGQYVTVLNGCKTVHNYIGFLDIRGDGK